MIDFHCHIDLYPQPQNVVKKINEANIYVLSVTTTPQAWVKSNQLVKDAPRCRTALGLHPQLAAERRGELDLFKYLAPHTKYIGEVGLDNSPESSKTLQTQHEVFDKVLMICKDCGGKVISIHSRNAVKPVLDLIRKHPGAGIHVLHWFTGSLDELNSAINANCYFSVNHKMLSSKKGQEIISRIPVDRLLPESDGPFTKLNGRIALPTDVTHVLEGLSRIWGTAADETLDKVISTFKHVCSQITL